MSNAAHRFLIILAITGCGDSYNAFSRWAPIRHPICHGTHHLPPNCAPSPRGRGDTQCGVGRAPPGFSKFTRIRGESKRSTVRLLSSSSSADSSADGVIPTTTDDPNEQSMTTLDRTLSRLTQGFPLYVLLAALSGVYKPSLLTWVNHGSLISVLLASVMCGTGLSLQADDFRRIPPYLVAFGVACQFLIMPVSSFLVANTWLKADPDLFLGLCLVGCSPGTYVFV
jgi:Sodium Bile acid symporter family